MLTTRGFLILTIVAQIIFTILPVCRFWLLRNKRRTITDYWSEGFFLIGCVIAFLNGIYVCYTFRRGMRLESYMTDELEIYIAINDSSYLKFLFFMGLGYITEIWAIKMAFLIFYTGLYNRVQSRIRYTVFVAYAIAFITYVMSITGYLTYCSVKKNWTLNLDQRCIAGTEFVPQTIITITNITTDLMVLALPFLIIRKLQFNRKQKLAVALVFVVGILTLTITLTRYVILNTLGALKKDKHQLATLFNSHLMLWLPTVEVTCAITAFSMPAFWTVIANRLQSRGGTSGQGMGTMSGMRMGRIWSRKREIQLVEHGGSVEQLTENETIIFAKSNLDSGNQRRTSSEYSSA